MDQVKSFIENTPWLENTLIFIIVFIATLVLAHLATQLVQRVLNHGGNPLPSSSIFVNITRAAIWCLGLSVILDTCFGINASALIAALGVAGIAISLGFQDTLSNLIGGLQLSLARLVEPGERVEIMGKQGLVQDITWRHTTLLDSDGNVNYIPNSIINKNSLTHLDTTMTVKVPFLVANGSNLEALTETLITKSSKALADEGTILSPVSVQYSGSTLGGLTGSICVTIERGSMPGDKVSDLISRAVAQEIAPS
ncbi:MAG: mechanosensitive ion channel family protein [Actinobacteria bacterium]|nr:mechanosensitive ion channel family protein [Actinomycetota bacterium]